MGKKDNFNLEELESVDTQVLEAESESASLSLDARLIDTLGMAKYRMYRSLKKKASEEYMKLFDSRYQRNNKFPTTYNRHLKALKEFCVENGITGAGCLRLEPMKFE